MIGNDGAMSDRRRSRAPLVISGLCLTGFTIALAALVSSQLALMSILDTTRAQRAADQIARSRFTSEVIEQAIERSFTPLTGPDVARQLAVATSSDPQVSDVVSSSLMGAHRQIVDADPGPAVDGNVQVRRAVARSVLDSATSVGLDPAAFGLDVAAIDAFPFGDESAAGEQLSVVPTDVPTLGLHVIAERTRIVAALAMFVLGSVALIAHPLPGRGLRRLGASIAVVCGVWLVGMLVAGWVIDLIANTLFGEMLQDVWRDATPSMLLLVGAGLLIGLGVAVSGIALDGYTRQRSQQRDWV